VDGQVVDIFPQLSTGEGSMPTVFRGTNRKITMYFRDHPPPHFHVITSTREEAQVNIESILFARRWGCSGYPRNFTKTTIQCATG
jgi:hypothetical protein